MASWVSLSAPVSPMQHIDWMLDHPDLGIGLLVYVALGGGYRFPVALSVSASGTVRQPGLRRFPAE